MNARQRLFQVELPLALPVILAGIRLSVIISLGTATIGSTVAAKGLGEVIIAGLQSNNVAFMLQGGLVVALLAVLIHDGMGLVERAAARRLGRPADEVAMTLLERLKIETRPAHDRIEAAIDLDRRIASRNAYRDLLIRFYGFHKAWESDAAEARA